jgi:hypothetical protein
LYDLSFGQFFLLVAISAALSMAVFAHAERHGSRHATAWGIATFLAPGAGLVYVIRYWLRTRRRSS